MEAWTMSSSLSFPLKELAYYKIFHRRSYPSKNSFVPERTEENCWSLYGDDNIFRFSSAVEALLLQFLQEFLFFLNHLTEHMVRKVTKFNEEECRSLWRREFVQLFIFSQLPEWWVFEEYSKNTLEKISRTKILKCSLGVAIESSSTLRRFHRYKPILYLYHYK